MEISLRSYGGSRNRPARIIEISFSDGNSSIVSDVTDLKGRVDEGFIADLESIVNELKEQNEFILKNTTTL